MRLGLVFAVVTLFAVACGQPGGATHTPRPTYTLYPTFTSEPHSRAGTSTRGISQESREGEFFEIDGRKEWFYGRALSYAEKGTAEFEKGNYQAAIDNLRRARQLRDEPSYVLENWMGLAYRALGQYPEAIRHHSASIGIDDNAIGRANRGLAYVLDNQCGAAVVDAKAALSMEPQSAPGIHTDAEANYILANCYAQDGQHLLALQHAEAGLSISIENGYGDEFLSEREALVEDIREALDPNQMDVEFFVASALEAWEQGIERYENGNYRAAIEYFETAKDHHGKPSTVLESWIGLSFQSLEQHEQAISHFARAIEIKDSATDRLNRSLSYILTAQCPMAIEDAEFALSLPPYEEEGYHTESEANSILAGCYMDGGRYKLAYVHAEAALNVAIASGYTFDDIALLIETRDLVKSLAESKK